MPQREFVTNREELETMSKISAKKKKYNSGHMSSYSTKAEELSNRSPMQSSSIPTNNNTTAKKQKLKKKKASASIQVDPKGSIQSAYKRSRSSKNREGTQSWSTIQHKDRQFSQISVQTAGTQQQNPNYFDSLKNQPTKKYKFSEFVH